MNGNVTYYFGHALTGQGVKHLYKEMIEEAELVYFLQGAPTFKGSELLKELGYFYVKQGFAVEWFKHALLEEVVEAVYVKGCNRLLYGPLNGISSQLYSVQSIASCPFMIV